jgi:hypothetical protein
MHPFIPASPSSQNAAVGQMFQMRVHDTLGVSVRMSSHWSLQPGCFKTFAKLQNIQVAENQQQLR